jgi:hypothetical protein
LEFVSQASMPVPVVLLDAIVDDGLGDLYDPVLSFTTDGSRPSRRGYK